MAEGPSLAAMTEARGSVVLTAAMVLGGCAALVGLVWWAMAGSLRPVAVPTSAGGAAAEAPTWVVPAASDEMGLRGLLTQPPVIARGRVVFAGLCVSCHGAHGEGGLGPNLRDDYWINGSQMTDVVRIISDGKPGTTAMQAMKHTYSAADIAALAAFVITLRGGSDGTNKAAEGTLQPITY